MCGQHQNQARFKPPTLAEQSKQKKTPTKTSNRQIVNPKQAKKAIGKYAGHFECLWHDPLAEMLKTPADSLCRRCFSNISRHQVLLIAQLMIRQELIDNHLERIDTIHKEILGVLDKLMEEKK